jgi:hypothetical protein
MPPKEYFSYTGDTGYRLTSTGYVAIVSYIGYSIYDLDHLYEYDNSKNHVFSVRCVRDD